MEKERKQKHCSLLKCMLLILSVVGIAYLVYYFFFADDCESLDEDFFDADEEIGEETEEKKEAPAEGPAEN